jgi:proline racemase
MRADHAFKIINMHTGGAPTRVVLAGIPPLSGSTMMEKMRGFAAEHDWIRRTLTLEPRGGGLTSVAVLVPPCDPDADLGVFFMEPHGYLPMCGSDTIGTVTALVETGQIATSGPEVEVRLDTPAGLVRARATVADGEVTAVTFRSAPAYAAALDATVDVAGHGPVTIDVGYGGNMYAIADAAQLDVELRADRTGPAIAAAAKLRAAVNEQLPVVHPELREVSGVTHVQLFSDTASDGRSARIMVIVPPGIVDRSPCGTGTTAKIATLLAKGGLRKGEAFTHHSVTGAAFVGRVVDDATVGDLPGCRVEISGRSFLIADTTVYVNHRDLLALGFQLS